MALLQLISRSARNIILLCPRSLRFNGRRKGFNIILFTFFILCFTFFFTHFQPNSPSLLGAAPKLILRDGNLVELSPKDSEILVQEVNPVMVTRKVVAVNEHDVKKDHSELNEYDVKKDGPVVKEYDIKRDGPARRLMSAKNCTKYSQAMVGDMKINPNITPTFEEVAKQVGPDLSSGGCYSPLKCHARQKVAIIIPFKDREAHLKTLLYHLHPMLMRQRIHYCIYVAEQYDNGQFNKATVMNAAFEEAVKLDNYDCIVFHDVDMIPENDRNLYMCGKTPRHLSPAIDKFNYKPHYGTDFGGVTAITVEQYRKANGHSNRFWGWGGEDNDMEFRIRNKNMSITPSPLKVGRYKMIPHLHPWKFSPNKFPMRLNKTRKIRADTDGLSDLQYKLLDTRKHPMYTKLVIDIRRIQVTKLVLYIDGGHAMDIDLYPGPCRYEEFEGKYLDYIIELTDRKEAQDLILWPGIKPKEGEEQMRIRDYVKGEDGKKKRFSMLHDLAQAQALCNKLAPECAGVEKENLQENYSLRRGAMPRHLVLTGPNIPRPPTVPPQEIDESVKRARAKRIILPDKKAYLRYCPGEYSHFKPHRPEFICQDSDRTCPHSYSFDVHFTVLMQPSEYMYYMDEKHFESHLEKGENHFTFTWPGNAAPNMSDPKTPRKYSFRTPDFAIPNIPGTYAVESRIIDKYRQPHFQWNWWFEVTSGDRYRDAETREAYWKSKINENMVKSKAQQHAAMMKQKAEKQKEREKEYQRRMKELKARPMRKPMPPRVKEVIDHVQKFYDKHEEGDPIEGFVDSNDPAFQSEVGHIKIDHENDENSLKVKTTTSTTTSEFKRMSTLKSKFHMLPPKKHKAVNDKGT